MVLLVCAVAAASALGMARGPPAVALLGLGFAPSGLIGIASPRPAHPQANVAEVIVAVIFCVGLRLWPPWRGLLRLAPKEGGDRRANPVERSGRRRPDPDRLPVHGSGRRAFF